MKVFQEKLSESQRSIEQLNVKIKDLEESVNVLSERIKILEDKVEGLRKMESHITAQREEMSGVQKQRKTSPVQDSADRIYKEALNLVNKNRCEDAIPMFMEILENYPSHSLADNAAYWTGECYFKKKDYTSAINYYLMVIEDFPQGNKVPDAMLKLAITYEKIGMKEKSEKYLEELMRLYPLSECAREAKILLQNIKTR